MAIAASTSELVTESITDLADNDNHEKKTKKFRAMSMKERTSYIKELITIEPLLTCYLMASVVCGPALNALELEKACKSNKGYNDTVCESLIDGTYELQNFKEFNDEVQQVILDVHSWQQSLQNIIPVILVLFLGSYSDRHKIRKPFLLIPIVGEFLSVVGCILCVVFMREWPLEVQGIMQTVVPSFLGGPTMIIMACFAYIADVSTLEMRTLRVGVVQIVLNLCTPIVQSFSGILFATIGYIGIFLIAWLLYLIGILYGFFWIKEPKKPVDVDKKSLIKDLFNPTLAIETINILLKNVKGNQRMGIVLILCVMFIFSGVVNAEGSVFFLFTQTVYKWTVVEFSYFLTINTIVHLVALRRTRPTYRPSNTAWGNSTPYHNSSNSPQFCLFLEFYIILSGFYVICIETIELPFISKLAKVKYFQMITREVWCCLSALQHLGILGSCAAEYLHTFFCFCILNYFPLFTDIWWSEKHQTYDLIVEWICPPCLLLPFLSVDERGRPLLGTIVGLPLFTKILKLDDLVITVITFLDKIACNIILIIFTTSTGLYAGTIVSIVIGISSITIRSQMTKVVTENDLGKAQSLFAITEALAPAILIPLYNKGIFSYTRDSFPALFFLMGIIFYAVGIALLLWLYFYNKKAPAASEIEKEGQGIELDNEKTNGPEPNNMYKEVYNTQM